MGSRAAYRYTGLFAFQVFLHVPAGNSRCSNCRTYESENIHPDSVGNTFTVHTWGGQNQYRAAAA